MPESELTDAVILCGGVGSRLQSVVADQPKALVLVDGRPFITYWLERLETFGLRRAVLCTGVMGEQFYALLGDGFGSIELVYSHESKPLGTGGALGFAAKHIRAATALVLNADSFCEFEFNALRNHHLQYEADATMVVVEARDARSSGRVEFDEQYRITRFQEKSSHTDGAWINAGIYLVARKMIDNIPANWVGSLEREQFPLWMKQRFIAYCSASPFIDIGTPDRIAKAGTFMHTNFNRH